MQIMLYHGTSAKHVAAILEKGILPRQSAHGTWTETVDSRHDSVYLTSCYALFYAVYAAKKDDVAIFEIDLGKLNKKKMLPDEDFLEQAMRSQFPSIMSMKERTEHLRNTLPKYRRHWTKSLEHLGTVAHQGIVPRKAITRYAIVDKKTAVRLIIQAHDPCITLMNHLIMGAKHHQFHQWLFGDAPDFDPEHHLQRTGIEIISSF